MSYRMLCCIVWLAACGKHTGAIDGPTVVRNVPWSDNAWTQPVPSWGSPVRLGLPVPLQNIVLGTSGGFGAFGAHEGGHVEGLNHVWIPITPGTVVRSWAAGKVTKIEDMGDRGLGNGVHEYFVTIDYGQGLVGKHLDVSQPLVKLGDTVKEGDPVGNAPSAEFMLIDDNRTDGERTGGTPTTGGSYVSPFDYLREDVKASLIARHIAEQVEPYFKAGKVAGNHRPWEPFLTNKMLNHPDHLGTIVGEWLLTNKGWSSIDPLYYEVMTIHDVTNAYGSFQRMELEDHDWSVPGNKRGADATWQRGTEPGTVIVSIQGSAPWYGRYIVDDTGSRAKLTIEWQHAAYPTAITANAAVYSARTTAYLQADAQALGVIK